MNGAVHYLATPGVQTLANEPFRCFVESRTRNLPWAVDLESFGWNGECACENFEFTCRPLLVRGAERAMSLQCWHTKRARFFLFISMGRGVPDPGLFFRVQIPSRSMEGEFHDVDLRSYNWNGECDCRHFKRKALPWLRQGAIPAPNLQCWHLEHARFHAFAALGKGVADQYYKRPKETRLKPGLHVIDGKKVFVLA